MVSSPSSLVIDQRTASHYIRERTGRGKCVAAQTNGAPARLRNQFLDDATVHVGQAEVAAGVAVGESFVVEAQ